ncbi:MAG: hypothetical protein C4519_19645 [Desulfobacteraceae bacterium]|nr:MAG: hypothetical protein C4519_19645 [Desulfobacteraceae bacterium]
MLEQFLITINQWMTTGSAIALTGAFLWGMVSVLFSPCHLASIPLIVAYVGGQQNAIHPLLFAPGHCLPIAAAGGSTAMVRKLTESGAWQGAGLWFRRAAGTLIALLGVYFIAKPLVGV